MDKFVIVGGGTKKQRELVHNITDWFCDKFFNRFKSSRCTRLGYPNAGWLFK